MLISKRCKSPRDELDTICEWKDWLVSQFGDTVFYDTSDGNTFDHASAWYTISRQYVDITGDSQHKRSIRIRTGIGWRILSSSPYSGDDSFTVYVKFEHDTDAVLFKLACL
jgi:hypothetical protein